MYDVYVFVTQITYKMLDFEADFLPSTFDKALSMIRMVIAQI